jgi:two-component system chemotaxis response regulator CheB
MKPNPIKVVIVEDSPVAQEFLTHILSSDPEIKIVSVAGNGIEALEAVAQHRPDVITMDIHMPVMDGFEATRHIMETLPTPIVIVSGSTGPNEISSTFRAIEAGALAVVRRPPGLDHNMFDAASKELIETVKLMSEVRVVRRIPRTKKEPVSDLATVMTMPKRTGSIQIAAFGASTGGPLVLQKILSRLPRDLPFPILIVQHIAAGFVTGFAEWLTSTTRFPLHIASNGEYPLPAHGYVAPDGFHMGMKNGPHIVLSDHASENGLRPSVAYLFRSVAESFGPNAVGVLLSGMGKDGVEELKLMKDSGAITIAQDAESSVVHGMPGEAIKLKAATYVLSPENIAAMLITLSKERNREQL